MASVKAVATAVASGVKKFYGKPMSVTSKVLGVATTAAVIYDSHINARERAYAMDEIKSADTFYNQYKQFMTSEKSSATICKMKKWWFDIQRNFPLDNIAYKTGGYISGFGRTVTRELPVLALSALALIPKNKTVNKVAGTFLALNGVQTLLTDVIGVGSTKSERNY